MLKARLSSRDRAWVNRHGGDILDYLRRVAMLAGALAVTASFSTSIEAADCQAPRPTWCAAGYACVPSDCLIALRVDLEEARLDNLRLRDRARLWHLDIAVGPSLAGVVDQDLHTRIVASPLALTAGIAFRIPLPRLRRADHP